VYTVRPGDTLWDVTGRFYGNPWEWPRVWSYNPEITNPHWIYPLDTLRLLAPGGEPVVEEAPGVRVARVGSRSLPGSVFLRQEGYLDREALAQSGVIAGSPEDHMLLAPYDDVYVEFQEGAQPRTGAEYTVYREIPSGERARGEEGTLVRIYGTVRIGSYDPERRTARATIIEALDPIERGFRVAPMPRQFDLVPPQPADRDLSTRVVATLRPRELLGEQQIVFVPVGGEDGVRLGNRFFVVRTGDAWRDDLPASAPSVGAIEAPPPPPAELPVEIVAEGRVVHVRPHSATLMITRSVREARIGDRAEMRRGY
ncbi:MAG TPA: LysM peptidoglycan-binding domain-containing protein, partial [Sandaracinaceae bacterium]